MRGGGTESTRQRLVVHGRKMGPRRGGIGHLAGEHEEGEPVLGQADLVTVVESGRTLGLAAVDRRSVLRSHVVELGRQVAVDDDRAMAAGDGRVVNNDVVVGQPADAVEADLEGYLAAAVEEPAVGT